MGASMFMFEVLRNPRFVPDLKPQRDSYPLPTKKSRSYSLAYA